MIVIYPARAHAFYVCQLTDRRRPGGRSRLSVEDTGTAIPPHADATVLLCTG